MNQPGCLEQTLSSQKKKNICLCLQDCSGGLPGGKQVTRSSEHVPCVTSPLPLEIGQQHQGIFKIKCQHAFSDCWHLVLHPSLEQRRSLSSAKNPQEPVGLVCDLYPEVDRRQGTEQKYLIAVLLSTYQCPFWDKSGGCWSFLVLSPDFTAMYIFQEEKKEGTEREREQTRGGSRQQAGHVLFFQGYSLLMWVNGEDIGALMCACKVYFYRENKKYGKELRRRNNS